MSADRHIYNLGLGFPDLDAMQTDFLTEISRDVINSRLDLQYGLDPRGSRKLSEQIAAFLYTSSHVAIDDSELLITNGSLHAIDLICRAMTQPGDVVIVEEPTFHDGLRIITLSNVQCIGVPLSTSGIDFDMLERLIIQYESRLRLFYTIPSYHNPTGLSATVDQRRRLAELAARYDFIIVEDAAYHYLGFGDSVLPFIKEFDEKHKNVITIGSFSKIIAPALRQGWIWAHTDIINRIAQYKTDGATGLLNSAIVAEYMQRQDLQQHIQNLRRFYANKCRVMLESLDLFLAPWASWTVPDGGFFLWVALRQQCSVEKLLLQANHHNVLFLPGKSCYIQHQDDTHLRLCFSYIEHANIRKAIQMLAACLDTP